MSTLTLTLANRTIHVVPGCGHGKNHFVWLGQISPSFAVVAGGAEDNAHETFADAIAFSGIDAADMSKIAQEIKADAPELTEDAAWSQATEGALSLNGGAKWIDIDDWGFWSPSVEEEKTLKTVAKILDACNGDPETACRVLRILGHKAEVHQ